MQSRRDHARDVEDEDVSGLHEVHDGAEMQMSNPARRAVQHQQAARSAVAEGVLSDELGGEGVVEVGGAMHASAECGVLRAPH